MSELYKKYVLGKKPSTYAAGIVNNICSGELAGDDLGKLIEEMKEQGKFNDAKVSYSPQAEWNEKYLDRLADEVIRGVFSREYLVYLGEVAAFVNGQNKKGKRSGAVNTSKRAAPEIQRKTVSVPAVAIGLIVLVGLAVFLLLRE